MKNQKASNEQLSIIYGLQIFGCIQLLFLSSHLFQQQHPNKVKKIDLTKYSIGATIVALIKGFKEKILVFVVVNWLSKKIGYTYTIRSRCSSVLLYVLCRSRESSSTYQESRRSCDAKDSKDGERSQEKVEWRIDLASEHEKYGSIFLCSFCLKLGVFIVAQVHPCRQSCSMLKDVHYYCVYSYVCFMVRSLVEST